MKFSAIRIEFILGIPYFRLELKDGENNIVYQRSIYDTYKKEGTNKLSIFEFRGDWYNPYDPNQTHEDICEKLNEYLWFEITQIYLDAHQHVKGIGGWIC